MMKMLQIVYCKKHLQKKLRCLCMEKMALKQALETTEKLFANQNADAESLSEEDLESMEGVVKINYDLIKT